MKKYVGQFRVIQQIDSNGEFTDNYDDTYIRCKNNIKMYRYSDNVLALDIPSPKIANKLKVILSHFLTEESKQQIKYEIENNNGSLSSECVFYFYENFISEVANIIKAKTNGAKITPRSIKNLPNKSKKYIEYNPLDKELMLQLQGKMKYIVDSNDKNISLYLKMYKYIEATLNIDILSYAKENKIKTYQAIDKLRVTKKAIDALESFTIS